MEIALSCIRRIFNNLSEAYLDFDRLVFIRGIARFEIHVSELEVEVNRNEQYTELTLELKKIVQQYNELFDH
jgi:hypothetical protein